MGNSLFDVYNNHASAELPMEIYVDIKSKNYILKKPTIVFKSVFLKQIIIATGLHVLSSIPENELWRATLDTSKNELFFIPTFCRFEIEIW